MKLRGVKFLGGFHDFTIAREGVRVFPRIVAAEHAYAGTEELIPSGIAELDALCGGGLDRSSSVLLIGPAGTGKSSLATQFVVSAAARGERGVIFTFDESATTLAVRSRTLGIPLDAHVRTGRILVRQIDPAELSPGEFGSIVQSEIAAGARTLLIDSLNGYLNAMPEERFLVTQMHELLTYAAQHGVLTMMTLAQRGVIGGQMTGPIDLSYLADTALLLRYFEVQGEIRKALSVVKRRRGSHEATIREFTLGRKGLRLGPPLRDFRGVLTGVPMFEGKVGSLVGTVRTDGPASD
ncbi:MAG: AAA family ATPase [Myxococcales bacterium]|nr:AAA family ATPase [Myxococcales bacterium]